MIGFRTLALILEAGYNVRAAVRNQAGFDRIAALPSVKNYASQLTSFIVLDITAPGAYDEAVKGVKYIVHVASPLAGNTKITDYDASLIQPAIQGTVGILESAAKTTGVERIVITASVSSIASGPKLAGGDVIDGKLYPAIAHRSANTYLENTLEVATEGPFTDDMTAYFASKALSYKATKDFITANKPAFDVINILPVFVIGRDETVTEASSIAKGTNGLIMGPLLGYKNGYPPINATVHVDDVAKLHLLALDPKVAGGQDFLAAGPDYGNVNWTDSLDIVKKRYPEESAEGIFPVVDITQARGLSKVDSSRATKVLGLEFKSFEEQVTSVVDHYLELVKQK